jgi:pilus assembly protein CpaF
MQPLLKSSTPVDLRVSQYQDVKTRVHEQLLNRLNLERLSQIRREEAEPELRTVIGNLLEKESEKTPLSLYERESIVVDVLNELFGLGPLEALLLDPDISDILVNRYDQIYIEKNGVLEPVDLVFKDDRHLMRIIERIVSTVGRRIDESSPMTRACSTDRV